jgi:hypothetical protein
MICWRIKVKRNLGSRWAWNPTWDAENVVSVDGTKSFTEVRYAI